MDKETNELQQKVELGFKASQFLEDDFGKTVFAYWESAKKGLNDISSVPVDSAEKMMAELMGRKITIDYINGFSIYLQGLIDEGKFALEEIKKLENKEELIQRV